MKKRTFKITVEYDISNIPKDFLTPKEIAKNIMYEELRDICAENEGFKRLKVSVRDN